MMRQGKPPLCWKTLAILILEVLLSYRTEGCLQCSERKVKGLWNGPVNVLSFVCSSICSYLAIQRNASQMKSGMLLFLKNKVLDPAVNPNRKKGKRMVFDLF